jgi:hypothetical protein
MDPMEYGDVLVTEEMEAGDNPVVTVSNSIPR